jgi:formate dehydrogenase alpha subunit
VTGLVTAFGSGAMTNSIADMTTKAQAYLVIGSNSTEQHPVIGAGLRRAVQRGAKLIVADPRAIPLTRVATLHLQHRPGSDVALLNGLAHIIVKEDLHDEEFIAGRTEGFEEWRESLEAYTPARVSKITDVAAELLHEAARIYATAKPACLIYAMGITQHTCGHENVLALANLALLTGNMGQPGGGVNPLRGQNNVQGACDMGCLSNVLPGYQRVTDDMARGRFERAWSTPLPSEPGLTVVEMMNAAGDGGLNGMYIVGENPMMSDPDVNHVGQCLQSLDFLVVQDIFLTETAQLADVVLPAASFAEKDGTFTNTERRVQRVRRATEPPGDARPDWEIVCELAKRMQSEGSEVSDAPHTGWNYESPTEIMDEIAALTPIYGGVSYERIDETGLQWPCPTPDHPGTPILHVGRFSRGLGRFSAVEFRPPAEVPDEEYPLILTTGRRLEHFHSGSMTRRVEGLNELAPEERIEINSVDAEQLGISDGDWVCVRSRRGEVRVRARVNGRCREGVVFMTFHFAEALGNVLTNPALDPVAKIPEYKACAVRVDRVQA